KRLRAASVRGSSLGIMGSRRDQRLSKTREAFDGLASFCVETQRRETTKPSKASLCDRTHPLRERRGEGQQRRRGARCALPGIAAQNRNTVLKAIVVW